MDYDRISGLLTIVICIVGAAISCKHYMFYRRSDAVLSQKVRAVFLTDGAIYGITVAFGLWALLPWDKDVAIVFHWIRKPILLANIWASFSLWSHYKERETWKS